MIVLNTVFCTVVFPFTNFWKQSDRKIIHIVRFDFAYVCLWSQLCKKSPKIERPENLVQNQRSNTLIVTWFPTHFQCFCFDWFFIAENSCTHNECVLISFHWTIQSCMCNCVSMTLPGSVCLTCLQCFFLTALQLFSCFQFYSNIYHSLFTNVNNAAAFIVTI